MPNDLREKSKMPPISVLGIVASNFDGSCYAHVYAVLVLASTTRSEKRLPCVEFESSDTHQSIAGRRSLIIQVRIDRVSKILLSLGEMAMFLFLALIFVVVARLISSYQPWE